MTFIYHSQGCPERLLPTNKEPHLLFSSNTSTVAVYNLLLFIWLWFINWQPDVYGEIMKFKMRKQELCKNKIQLLIRTVSQLWHVLHSTECHMDCFSTSLQAFSRDYSNNWDHEGMWIFYVCNTTRQCIRCVLPVIIAFITAINILYPYMMWYNCPSQFTNHGMGNGTFPSQCWLALWTKF